MDTQKFIDEQIALLQKQVGESRVLLGLSGGVDSSVCAALLQRAVPGRLVCVHVNHGLMRAGESEAVVEAFSDMLGCNLIYVDAGERFLSALHGIADPEEKRKIIGTEFIRVFEEEARRLRGIDFLAQGTIYPDIVESGAEGHKTVKAHHNVGGLPDDMGFELVEPLKTLYKDEVREVGLALGLPPEMIWRQPFPGPGLGVRVLGEITKERLEMVRQSDLILRNALEEYGLAGEVWQYFTLVPEFKSVGVRDDARTWEYPVIIRAVNSQDAMTAKAAALDIQFLLKVSERILTGVKGVNRVLYDLTAKPPGTIEWE